MPSLLSGGLNTSYGTKPAIGGKPIIAPGGGGGGSWGPTIGGTPVTMPGGPLLGASPTVSSTTPKLNTSSPIPSTALTSPTTPSDVLTKRAQLETVKNTAIKLQSMLNGTASPLDTTQRSPLDNPEAAVLKFLNGEQPTLTTAQTQEQGFLAGIRDKTKEFFSGREAQIAQDYKDAGVADARTALAETQKRKAERQVQLRNDLKDLETTASERGVPREFAIDRRNQINSDAYFELANISIVEAAQQGNLTQARTDAKDLIDQQFNAFDGYIKQQQAELDYLAPTLSADQKRQAEIVQFQLDQYKQQLKDKKDAEMAKYDYLAEAAKNGAPNSVNDAILKATTQDEAARLAAPYIGLLERQNTKSLIAERGRKSTEDLGYVPITPEDKKTLIGQGFTQAEIDDIPKIVADFGIQALLDEYKGDAKKLKAVTTIYNDPVKQQFLTPEFLKSTFGASSVDEMATAMGKTRDDYRKFFSSASSEEAAIKKDFENYINTTLVPLIEQYRASGFSDKDILAMMK